MSIVQVTSRQPFEILVRGYPCAFLGFTKDGLEQWHVGYETTGRVIEVTSILQLFDLPETR